MHGFTDKNAPKSGPLCGMSVLSHLRYVFRSEDELGKSHNLLSINAFKVHGVDFEYIVVTNFPLPRSKGIVVWRISSYPESSSPHPEGGRTMRPLCHLPHWLRGSGPRLQVADVVPKTIL